MSKKCIVFGGSGFIGSHLTQKLIQDGHDVIVFSRKPLQENQPNTKIVYGDFMNADDIDEAIKGSDYVFHLISLTNPASSDNDPFIDMETNVKMSIHLLQSCVKHGVKRVVFASSGGAIYGNVNKQSVNEETPTRPVSPYGIGKETIEGYLRYFQAKHGLDYVALRIANAYGVGQNNSKGNHGVIPIFLQQVLQGQEVTIMGEGEMVRDYVYVTDVVNFMAKVFDADHERYIYNVGSGLGTSVKELLGVIEDITGRSARVRSVKTPDSYIAHIVLDTSLAVEEFGVFAKVDLAEGVNKIFSSMRAAPK